MIFEHLPRLLAQSWFPSRVPAFPGQVPVHAGATAGASRPQRAARRRTTLRSAQPLRTNHQVLTRLCRNPGMGATCAHAFAVFGSDRCCLAWLPQEPATERSTVPAIHRIGPVCRSDPMFRRPSQCVYSMVRNVGAFTQRMDTADRHQPGWLLQRVATVRRIDNYKEQGIGRIAQPAQG